jgi:hypothetical protein
VVRERDTLRAEAERLRAVIDAAKMGTVT